MAASKFLENRLNDEEMVEYEGISTKLKKVIALSSIMDGRMYNALFEEVSSPDFKNMLDKLSGHLDRIIAREEKEGEEHEKAARVAKEARSTLKKLIKDQGLNLTVEELLQDPNFAKPKGKKSATTPVPPKYRIKDEDGNTVEWTGRGMKPKPYKKFLEEGGNLDDLLISK